LSPKTQVAAAILGLVPWRVPRQIKNNIESICCNGTQGAKVSTVPIIVAGIFVKILFKCKCSQSLQKYLQHKIVFLIHITSNYFFNETGGFKIPILSYHSGLYEKFFSWQ
jgi:hypothetical protein